MEQSPQSKGAARKLESLPKEELLKFIKKQALSSKDLKKKIEDLNNEICRMEKEKKDWLTQGVSAEFEKKEKLMSKENELLLAAELGKEMLAENDDLQVEIDELKLQHSDNIQSCEDEIDELLREKGVLEDALRVVQEDYRIAIKEAHECREELKEAMKNTPTNTQSLVNENEELKMKVKELEQQLTAALSNTKFNKLKEKHDKLTRENDDLTKENKSTKVSFAGIEEDCKKKSEQMVALDKEMKHLKKESAEIQKQLKATKSEIETLVISNENLATSLQTAEETVKTLEERNIKLKQEKDNQSKAMKSTKTKLERASQMEEKKGKGVATANKEGGCSDKILAEKEECIKELQNQMALLEKENMELQNGLTSVNEKNEQVTQTYQVLLTDYENLNFKITEEKDNSKMLQCENDTFVEEITILNDKLKVLQQTNKTTTKKNGKGKKGNKKGSQTSSENEQKTVDKVQYDELKFTNENLEKEIEMYRSKSPETKGTILRLENRVDDLLLQLQTINEEKLHQESELEELFKSLDDLQTKYDFECKEREMKEHELHCLEEKLHEKEQGQDKSTLELEDHISELEKTIKELRSSIDYLKQEVQVKEDCRKKLHSDIEEAGRKQNEINTHNNEEVDNIVNEINQLNEQLTETKIELDETKIELDETKIELDETKIELDKSIKENKKKQDIIVDLDESLQHVTKQLEDMKCLCNEKDEVISSLNETSWCNVTQEGQQNECKGIDFEAQADFDNDLFKSQASEFQSQLKNLEVEKNNEIELLQREIESLQKDLECFDTEYQHTLKENHVSQLNFDRLTVKEKEAKELLIVANSNYEQAVKDVEVLNKTLSEFDSLSKQLGCETSADSFLLTYQEEVKTTESLRQELEASKLLEVDLQSKLNDVEKQCNEYEKNISELKQELINIHQDIDNMTSSLNVSKDSVSQLTKQIENEKSNYDVINTKYLELEKIYENEVKVNEVNSKTIECNKEEIVKTQDQIQHLIKENENLVKLHEVAEKQSESLSKVSLLDGQEGLTEKYEILKCDMDSKNIIIDDLKVQLNENKKKFDVLNETIKEYKVKHENNLSCVADKEQEITQLHQSLDKLKEMYNELRVDGQTIGENHLNELYEKENLIKELKTEVSSLQESLEQCHNKITEFAEMCNTLNDTADEHKTHMNTYEKDNKDLLQSLAAVKKELEEKQLHFEQTDAIVKSKEDDLNKLQNEISNLQNQIQTYEDQISSYANNILTKESEFQTVLSKQEIKLKELESQLKESEGLQQNQSDEQTSVFSDQIMRLQNEVDSKSKLQSEVESKVKELEHIISEYKNKCETLEQQLTEKSKQVDIIADESYQSSNNSTIEHTTKISELEDKCLLLQDENKMLSDDLVLADEQCKSLMLIVEESERLKGSFGHLEEELQSALNKVDELDGQLKCEQNKAQQFETLVEEKHEKCIKFKNMAIKAKKELDSKRSEYQEGKTNLENHLKLSYDEVKLVKAELTRQKTECAKHEEEFVEMQNEIKVLEDQNKYLEDQNKLMEDEQNSSHEHVRKNEELQQRLDEITLSKCSNEEVILSLQNDMKDKKVALDNNVKLQEELSATKDLLLTKDGEIKQLNDEYKKLEQILQQAEKGSQQLSLMNLEMDDYLKTTETLNQNIKMKEEEILKMIEEKKQLEDKYKSLKDENNTQSIEKTEQDSLNRKLKQMIMKLKKEISEGKKNMEEKDSKEIELQKSIELMLTTNDECKIEISTLSSDKISLKEQLKRTSEMHDKSYQSLEVKYARSNNDLVAVQTLYQELQEEFENYKIRAHNVLKQQKNVKTETQKENEEKERSRLDEIIDDLKIRLQETSRQLNILQGEHGDLEIDYERLQGKYNETLQQNTHTDLQWKQRFSQLKSDTGSKVSELQNKLIETEQQAESRKLESEISEKNFIERENELQTEIRRLKEEVYKLEKRSNDQMKELNKQDSNESRDLTLDLSKTLIERQDGEGMDSKELELIDSLSQRSSVPHTPLSPTNAFILESLLSPTTDTELPKSPSELKDEVSLLKSSVAIITKKNEHVTSLLSESEENTSRLVEQAKVLKEEIRRLERNAEREEAVSNLEYLKNVIIKFLQVNSVEKEQLIPVLCTMLKLSNQEKEFISEFAKGDNSDGGGDNASWSSYMYSWTSIS